MPSSIPPGLSKSSTEEEKNLYLDRPMKGKSQEQFKRHSLESSIDSKPIERSLFILTMGDDAQKISVVHSLPQLITLDSSAVYNRIIPKIKQDLPASSCEFQIATSAIFMLLLKRSANTSILQSILQGLDSKDPNVAFAWSEALYGSMSSLPEIMIQNYLLPLAKQKSQPNSTVISKLFCCKLMGEICSNAKFRMLDVKRDILPIVIGMCQDGHADVRSQMCAFMPKIVSVLGNDWEKTNLLSCILDLAQDENLNVRATSIVAITSMLKITSPETSKNTLLPLIKKICSKACDESLVTALILSDEFGALMREMPAIHEQDVMFFVRIYKQMSAKGKQVTAAKANASIEVTIRQRCASNTCGIMKLVLQSLPSQLQEVYASFRDHAIDPCYLVRRAAAAILADIAQLLGNENRILKNEIVRLLRDDAVEVLEAIVPTISTLFTSLVSSGALSYSESSQITTELCKALTKCQNELAKRYNWRLSIEFMKQLEVLPTCVPSDYIHNNFTPNLFDKLIYGKAKPIRIQAARTLVVFMRYNFKPNQTKWIRDSLIRQTAQSRNCHSRILYFYVCDAVLAVFSEKYFKEWFLAPCLVLAQDKIANIRWKFMQFSSKLKSMVTLANDVQAKQKILDSVSRLESFEKTKTVQDIIRAKRREPLPKYSAEALREEETRVREEATTNIGRREQAKAQVVSAPVNRKPAGPPPDMPFLEQHFYIDAGIKLESITCPEMSSKFDIDAHLDPSDLIAIETCSISDDAKVNLRNNFKGISKLTPSTSYFDSGDFDGGETRNKRHSSIISASCLIEHSNKPNDKSMHRRRSLNLNHYRESKIPIANRNQLSTINRNATKEIQENVVDLSNTNKSLDKSEVSSVSKSNRSVSALPVGVNGRRRTSVSPKPAAVGAAGAAPPTRARSAPVPVRNTPATKTA